jgi:hypothetical protein
MFSSTHALPENREAYVDTRIWQVWPGRSDRPPTQSDRPDQIPQKAICTSPLDRTRRVDQDSYIECPNRSPDEGDTASGRSARWARG